MKKKLKKIRTKKVIPSTLLSKYLALLAKLSKKISLVKKKQTILSTKTLSKRKPRPHFVRSKIKKSLTKVNAHKNISEVTAKNKKYIKAKKGFKGNKLKGKNTLTKVKSKKTIAEVKPKGKKDSKSNNNKPKDKESLTKIKSNKRGFKSNNKPKDKKFLAKFQSNKAVPEVKSKSKKETLRKRKEQFLAYKKELKLKLQAAKLKDFQKKLRKFFNKVISKRKFYLKNRSAVKKKNNFREKKLSYKQNNKGQVASLGLIKAEVFEKDKKQAKKSKSKTSVGLVEEVVQSVVK